MTLWRITTNLLFVWGPERTTGLHPPCEEVDSRYDGDDSYLYVSKNGLRMRRAGVWIITYCTAGRPLRCCCYQEVPRYYCCYCCVHYHSCSSAILQRVRIDADHCTSYRILSICLSFHHVPVFCLSVCPSVRPSVTFRYCVQINEDTVMLFSASGRTIPLVCGEVKFTRCQCISAV